MTHVINATISSAVIDKERGLLTSWLHLDYDDTSQSFGGFALYLPKDWKHSTNQQNYAGHFISRCMEIAGVTYWAKMSGTNIRVKLDGDDFNAKIVAIGHIIKDVWFDPVEEFKQMKLGVTPDQTEQKN